MVHPLSAATNQTVGQMLASYKTQLQHGNSIWYASSVLLANQFYGIQSNMRNLIENKRAHQTTKTGLLFLLDCFFVKCKYITIFKWMF